MIFNGKEYKAVHSETCAGCSFKGKEDCMKLPEPCMKMYREDKKGVIWVKDKK